MEYGNKLIFRSVLGNLLLRLENHEQVQNIRANITTIKTIQQLTLATIQLCILN